MPLKQKKLLPSTQTIHVIKERNLEVIDPDEAALIMRILLLYQYLKEIDSPNLLHTHKYPYIVTNRSELVQKSSDQYADKKTSS